MSFSGEVNTPLVSSNFSDVNCREVFLTVDLRFYYQDILVCITN